MRLPVETLKICPQLVGIKPKLLLRKLMTERKKIIKICLVFKRNTSLLFPEHVRSYFWLQILYP
jgi:hypothetical protein